MVIEISDIERKNIEKIEKVEKKGKRDPFDNVEEGFTKMLSHAREYPDLFLDSIRDSKALYSLTPFQRVYLRAFFRYNKVGIVATRGTSKCVIGDTLITTENGLVKIGDLANWEKEESEKISFNKVMNINGEMETSDIIVNSGYKETKKISTNMGYELEGTHIHPVIVMNEQGDMEFKNLEDIQIGDRVAINRKGNFGNNDSISIDDAYKLGAINRDSTIDKDILSSKKEILANYVCGLFDSSATFSENQIGYETKSKDLSLELQQVLLQFGIISNRNEIYNDLTKERYYKISIYKNDAVKYKENINSKLINTKKHIEDVCSSVYMIDKDTIPYQKEKLKKINFNLDDEEISYAKLESIFKDKDIETNAYYAHLIGYYEDNFYWDKVADIEDKENYVYDFHVPESHTFIGNGFVNHNTYVHVLAKLLRCILYPNSHQGISMPTQTQSSKITQDKLDEIFKSYPLLKEDVLKDSSQRDYTKIEFKNGSIFETLTVGEGTRGARVHDLGFEEIVNPRMDKDTINEVMLPTMAQPRTTMHGVDPNEISLQEGYVTTASNKQSYCYEKIKEISDDMQNGKSAILLISSYEMGLRFKTLQFNKVKEKIDSPTYSPLAFDREFRSIFTGSSSSSLVSSDELYKNRILKEPEYYADKNDKEAFYILSYDVARSPGSKNAQSSLVVIKCIPRGDGTFIRHIVNIFSFEGTHFESQAKFLKQKVVEYDAQMLCVDANGLGVGLIDFLVLEIDENPPYHVVNLTEFDYTKKPNSIGMIFAVKSQAKETKESDMVNRFMYNVNSGDIKMLLTESMARGSKTANKLSKQETGHELAEYLLPFIETDKLIDEIMNLEYQQKGNNTSIKTVSTTMNKDRYSALAYGNFYIYLQEQKERQRASKKQTNPSQMFAMRAPNFDVFANQSKSSQSVNSRQRSAGMPNITQKQRAVRR